MATAKKLVDALTRKSWGHSRGQTSHIFFSSCRDCGAADSSHYAKGLCRPCYFRRIRHNQQRDLELGKDVRQISFSLTREERERKKLKIFQERLERFKTIRQDFEKLSIRALMKKYKCGYKVLVQEMKEQRLIGKL